MNWLEAIPIVGKLIDLVGKWIPDKDKAQAAAVEIATLVMGKGSEHWLPANAFSIAMLLNFGGLITMYVLRIDPPEACLVIALAWLAGPLLNVLSKETRQSIENMAKKTKTEWPKENKGETK